MQAGEIMTELEEFASKLGVNSYTDSSLIFSCWDHRQTTVKTHSFSIPTEESLDKIRLYNPLLEVGAGTDYWAYEMRKKTIDVIATDISPEPMSNQYEFSKIWTHVEALSAIDAVRKYPDRTLFVSWPTLGESWITEALKEYKGKYFIFVGESAGGCTADDAFFGLLEKEWVVKEYISLLCWPGIHDSMCIFQRNIESSMEAISPRKVSWR